MLAQLLINGDEHDAAVMNALKPKEHAHDAGVQHQDQHGREPVPPAAAQAGLVKKRGGEYRLCGVRHTCNP